MIVRTRIRHSGMNTMTRQTFARSFIIALLAAVVGCSHATKKNAKQGSAFLAVTTQGLSASDVSDVVVTVSLNGGGPTPIVQHLTNTSQGWRGLLGNIPVGNEHFDVVALDSGANPIFSGSADT